MIQWGGSVPSSRLREFLSIIASDVIFRGTPDFAKIRLFQNDITPNPGTLLADLTEATFSGYAAQVVEDTEITTVRNDLDGNAFLLVNILVTFAMNADTVPNTVFGWYITNAGGTAYYAAKRFTNGPIEFNLEGVKADMEIALRMIVGGVEPGDDTTVSFTP